MAKDFNYYLEAATPKQKDRKRVLDLIFTLKTNLSDLQVAVVDDDFDEDSTFYDDAKQDLEEAHEAVLKLMEYLK